MTFTEAISSGLSNYANFAGRASRSEYWYWVLFQVVVAIGASIVDVVATQGILGVLTGLGLLLPSIAVSVRRLHDIGKSGWNILWGLVPIFGFVYLVYLYVQPSASNAYSRGQRGRGLGLLGTVMGLMGALLAGIVWLGLASGGLVLTGGFIALLIGTPSTFLLVASLRES